MLTVGKPGYKTTEFYVTIITIVAAWADAYKGSLPDKYAVYASALSSLGYALARGLAKKPSA